MVSSVSGRAFASARGRLASAPRRTSIARAGQKKDGRSCTSPDSVQIAALTFALALAAEPARADVDGAVTSAVDTVKALGEFVKSGISAAEGAGKAAGEAYERVSPQINELIDKASPYVKSTLDEVTRVATPAAKQLTSKAAPVITEKTREALAASGINVRQLEQSADSASRTVGEATKVATPTLTKIINFLTTSSPETLGKVALAAVAIYFLTPIAIKLLLSSFRGYAGDTTPARAVDIVASEPSAVLIDIRSAREKQAVGVPDVPGSARGRFIELEMAEIERRLRGQLKNVDAVEAQVTALEIQALKRIDKSSQVLLLDKGGSGPAKAVAKELSRLGFRSVFIVNGGFTAWAQSKLQIRRPVDGKQSGGSALKVPDILGTIRIR